MRRQQYEFETETSAATISLQNKDMYQGEKTMFIQTHR